MRRDNVGDALAKMQACMDSAAESLIPPEVDPRESEANCQTVRPSPSSIIIVPIITR